ncbi:SH3 domain-containing protein [Oleiagrimonas soli]|uniref:Uncharacterized protein YraI n=1 Tax=Oleiagrimonas soli TaxID=1543381 RepID=A0A841KB75_9GAMM|nr:SH3 domain-containing protein [Oleiagrimonas soli]MBB6182833.1 uncharacterized protein YraI [Oleiagrimonas soli]
MRRHAWLFAFTLLLALPAAAQATRAYADVTVNMRAGPDIGYPIVDLIPGGTPLYVQGCTDDWAWCDVIAYGHRGWVAGNFIRYPYRQRWVPIYGYGAIIGIPVVRFVIGDYWHRHYRHRAFYGHRDYWYGYHPRHRAPPYRYRHAPPRFVHRDHDRDRYRYRQHVEREHIEHRRVERHRAEQRRHERQRFEHRRDEHRRVEQHQAQTRRRLAPTVLHRSAPEYRGARAPHRNDARNRASAQRNTQSSHGSSRNDNHHRGKNDHRRDRHDRDKR